MPETPEQRNARLSQMRENQAKKKAAEAALGLSQPLQAEALTPPPVYITKPVPDSDGMVTITENVYDPAQDRYVKKQRRVDPNAPVEVVSEPEDAFGGDMLWLGPEWENGRGKEFHARWVNVDPKHQGDERANGYALVHPDDFKTNRFALRKTEGQSRTGYTRGDLVLMEVPLDKYNRRQHRNEDRYKRELMEMQGAVEGETDARVRSEFGEGAYVGYSRKEEMVSRDPTDMEMDMEIEASMGEGAYAVGDVGRRTFGGYQGNPQYNRTNFAGPKPNYGWTPDR